MIRFRHKKTGKFYALLAHGVDATNSRAGTPVVVYSPEDNEHMIYVREEAEFFDKFEEAKPDVAV